MGVDAKGGLVIRSVDEGSFAEDIGLFEKDVILSINRQPVSSVEDVIRIQSALKPGDAVAFRIMRPTPAGAVARRNGPRSSYPVLCRRDRRLVYFQLSSRAAILRLRTRSLRV